MKFNYFQAENLQNNPLLGEKYYIWKTNKFDDDILSECVATFHNLDFAKDFVAYQATLGESFAIIDPEGERIEI